MLFAFAHDLFYQRPVTVAEHEQRRTERIEIQLAFDDRNQAIDDFAHIHRLTVQIDRASIVRWPDHVRRLAAVVISRSDVLFRSPVN